METYFYKGPVTQFGDRVIHSNWTGVTKATSKNKAYANLCYQFKKEYEMELWSKIELNKALIKTEGERYEENGQLAFRW